MDALTYMLAAGSLLYFGIMGVRRIFARLEEIRYEVERDFRCLWCGAEARCEVDAGGDEILLCWWCAATRCDFEVIDYDRREG